MCSKVIIPLTPVHLEDFEKNVSCPNRKEEAGVGLGLGNLQHGMGVEGFGLDSWVGMRRYF